MKSKMIFLICISLLVIVSMGTISASEDIANDNVTLAEPTGEAIDQSVDEIETADETLALSVDEIETADDENIMDANDGDKNLSDDEPFAKVIWPHDDYFFYKY